MGNDIAKLSDLYKIKKRVKLDAGTNKYVLIKFERLGGEKVYFVRSKISGDF